jgi:hypothetical protein
VPRLSYVPAAPLAPLRREADLRLDRSFSVRWVFDVDKIIAWRPSPATAVEDPLPPGTAADYRKALPREYLVKWIQLGFRHIE